MYCEDTKESRGEEKVRIPLGYMRIHEISKLNNNNALTFLLMISFLLYILRARKKKKVKMCKSYHSHYGYLRVRALIAGKARCEYPGEPSNGRIIPLKFWYAPGDKLKITCLAGYVLPLPLEASPPVCLDDSTWSYSLPECIPYTNV